MLDVADLYHDVGGMTLPPGHPLARWHRAVGALRKGADASPEWCTSAEQLLDDVVQPRSDGRTGPGVRDDLLDTLGVRVAVREVTVGAPTPAVRVLEQRAARDTSAEVPASWRAENVLDLVRRFRHRATPGLEAAAWRSALRRGAWSEEEAIRFMVFLLDWVPSGLADPGVAAIRLELLRDIDGAPAGPGLAGGVLLARAREWASLAVHAARAGHVQQVEAYTDLLVHAISRAAPAGEVAVTTTGDGGAESAPSPLLDLVLGCCDALLASGLRGKAHTLHSEIPRMVSVGDRASQFRMLERAAARLGLIA